MATEDEDEDEQPGDERPPLPIDQTDRNEVLATIREVFSNAAIRRNLLERDGPHNIRKVH